MHRRTLSERYSVEILKTVVGVPWQMTPNNDIDYEGTPGFRAVPGDEREEHGHQVGSQMPCRTKMTKEIMDKYSMTPQCPRCINLVLGRYHRPHLESCRKRIEDFLHETGRRVEVQSGGRRGGSPERHPSELGLWM